MNLVDSKYNSFCEIEGNTAAEIQVINQTAVKCRFVKLYTREVQPETEILRGLAIFQLTDEIKRSHGIGGDIGNK